MHFPVGWREKLVLLHMNCHFHMHPFFCVSFYSTVKSHSILGVSSLYQFFPIICRTKGAGSDPLGTRHVLYLATYSGLPSYDLCMLADFHKCQPDERPWMILLRSANTSQVCALLAVGLWHHFLHGKLQLCVCLCVYWVS